MPHLNLWQKIFFFFYRMSFWNQWPLSLCKFWLWYVLENMPHPRKGRPNVLKSDWFLARVNGTNIENSFTKVLKTGNAVDWWMLGNIGDRQGCTQSVRNIFNRVIQESGHILRYPTQRREFLPVLVWCKASPPSRLEEAILEWKHNLPRKSHQQQLPDI